jgi:hypothetical protein
MTPVQETPQIFTLALVLCVFASLVILLTAAYRLIRGRRASALRLLAGWGLGVFVYLTVSVAVSLVRPARVIELGQNWCFDDWCIAVERVRHIASPNQPWRRSAVWTLAEPARNWAGRLSVPQAEYDSHPIAP